MLTPPFTKFGKIMLLFRNCYTRVKTHVAAVRGGEDVVLGDDDPAAKVVRSPAAPQQLQRRLVRDAVGHDLGAAHDPAVFQDPAVLVHVSGQPEYEFDKTPCPLNKFHSNKKPQLNKLTEQD